MDSKKNGTPPFSLGDLPVIHDVIFALSFLAIITAPAFIVMRSDRGHQDS